MKKALVFLADGCEMCEALCVVDVLRRAGINVFTAGVTGERVVSSHNVEIKADVMLSEVKNEEWEALKKEAEHIQKVKEQAVKANVRVTKELHPNVVLSVNGTELETRETYKGGNFTKEKLLAMLNTKK